MISQKNNRKNKKKKKRALFYKESRLPDDRRILLVVLPCDTARSVQDARTPTHFRDYSFLFAVPSDTSPLLPAVSTTCNICKPHSLPDTLESRFYTLLLGIIWVQCATPHVRVVLLYCYYCCTTSQPLCLSPARQSPPTLIPSSNPQRNEGTPFFRYIDASLPTS